MAQGIRRCTSESVASSSAACVVRVRLLARAFGRVVEVGGGTGEHLALYAPETVERVTVVGPDIWTRAMVERRARAAAVPVDLVDERLPAGLEAGTVNVMVVSYLLCALSDRHTLLTDPASRPTMAFCLFRARSQPVARCARRPCPPAWRGGDRGCDSSQNRSRPSGAQASRSRLDRSSATLQLPSGRVCGCAR